MPIAIGTILIFSPFANNVRTAGPIATGRGIYPVYMSAKVRRIYVTFGLTSVKTHEEYLARDVNLT